MDLSGRAQFLTQFLLTIRKQGAAGVVAAGMMSFSDLAPGTIGTMLSCPRSGT